MRFRFRLRSMRNSAGVSLCTLALGLAPAGHAQTPLSAIDWLSESILESPAVPAPQGDITDSAAIEEITVRPLDAVSRDSIGVIAPQELGLPASVWGTGESRTIAALIAKAGMADTLPAIARLQRNLLLASTVPPLESDGVLFLARLDALLDLGALDDANALLGAAGFRSPDLFRRWFDISLLTGAESHACDAMRDSGDFAPTYQARIFCLARNGDWTAAALTLNSAEVLDVISAGDHDLIARFLDPYLFEDEPQAAPPAHPSPLIFRIYEAIGESIPTTTLPRAFAQADLRPIVGWKARLKAAERLIRAHAIPSQKLRDIYSERSPAASGGIWDRVRVFQRLDRAIRTGDANAIARALPDAHAMMRRAGMEYVLADLHAGDLLQLPLRGAASKIAFHLVLLSDHFADERLSLPDAPDARMTFLMALAQGRPTSVAPLADPRIQAVRDGFDGALPGLEYRLLLRDGRLGEAILHAAQDFTAGRDGDLDLVARSLRLLRHVGLENTARLAALQFLIMDADAR